MAKVLKLQVGIKGPEDKIWRHIEITDRRTVVDLAYTILATFDFLAYHLYDVKHGNSRLRISKLYLKSNDVCIFHIWSIVK